MTNETTPTNLQLTHIYLVTLCLVGYALPQTRDSAFDRSAPLTAKGSIQAEKLPRFHFDFRIDAFFSVIPYHFQVSMKFGSDTISEDYSKSGGK